MTARPDPASFERSPGFELSRGFHLSPSFDLSPGFGASYGYKLPTGFDVPCGTEVSHANAPATADFQTASIARKFAVLAMLVAMFLMVPSLQERGFFQAGQALSDGPSMVAADRAARQQTALLTARI